MERRRLYARMLAELLDTGTVSREARVLVSCAGKEDHHVLAAAGFRDITGTGIRDGINAEALPFPDLSFDLAVVSAGLHHCRQPHRALLELVRVAPVTMGIEARDTLLIRTLTRLGLLEEHEHSAVRDGGRDGLEGTSTANYVYRWSERELRKTVASYLPGEDTRVVFRRDVDFPRSSIARGATPDWLLRLEPAARVLARVVPSQANLLGFVIVRA